MPEHRAVIESLVRPFAVMTPAGQPTRVTQSCVGGCPFLPEDVAWPTYDGDHMSFLAQVNFAEVASLPGFPTSGLLQWFVASTGNYGMTYDETAGTVGFEARWYPVQDLTVRPRFTPGETLPFSPRNPGPAGHGGWGTAVAFAIEDGVPSREEIDSLEVPGYRLLREADPDWEIYDSDDNPLPYGSGSKGGGYPYPVQNDPRFGFPDRCPTLLIQLDAEFTMWGDAGAAQLFGDPGALGRGDVSSLWWDWACG
jgi:uncharacterized protein YwqG